MHAVILQPPHCLRMKGMPLSNHMSHLVAQNVTYCHAVWPIGGVPELWVWHLAYWLVHDC